MKNFMYQFLQGEIDLLVETPAEFVIIIDHKSSMGSTNRLQEIAEAYSGQLDAYASANDVATGKNVLEKWFFLTCHWDDYLCCMTV